MHECARVLSYLSCMQCTYPILSVASLVPPYFRHYLINSTIFGKQLLDIKCVFWFSLQLAFDIFLILRRTVWDIVINVKMSSRKVPVMCTLFLSDFNDTRILTDFLKNSNIKFHQSPSSGSWVVPCRQTDRHIYIHDYITLNQYQPTDCRIWNMS
jgi:hypothetical protein